MENRRRHSDVFAFYLATLVAIIFCAILVVLVFGKLGDASVTAVEQWGTAIVSILAMAAAYQWGSSKGSAMKDELAAARAAPPEGQKIDSTTVSTVQSGPTTEVKP